MANRVELYYGPPGSGKTSSIVRLIERMYEKTGKKARIFAGDGSPIMYEGLVDAGYAEMMDFGARDNPFSVCRLITTGHWPEDVHDPTSKFVKLTPQQVAETGMWVYEGAAVMGAYMMGDKPGGLARRAAEGETIGQDTNIRFADKETGMQFGGNPAAHYNVTQRHLHADIIASKALPGWVIWTTHERMDDGERSQGLGQQAVKFKLGDKMIGPELVGKALTSNISRDFGNTLHFTTASKKVSGAQDAATGKTSYTEQQEYRIYTVDHYDPDGIVALKYSAVCRALDPKKIKPYYTGEPGQAILEFYSDLEQANKLVKKGAQ